VRHLRQWLATTGVFLAHASHAWATDGAPACAPGTECETLAAAGAPVASTPLGATADEHANSLGAELLLHFGIATPVGGAGVTFDVLPVDWLALGAGVGTNGEGPELETMARARLGVGLATYLTFGTGVSLAHYTGHDHNGLDSRDLFSDATSENTTSYAVWPHAIFWNNELGVETSAGHLALRAYLGYASILNPLGYTCTEGYRPCNPSAASPLVYLGFAIGYRF